MTRSEQHRMVRACNPHLLTAMFVVAMGRRTKVGRNVRKNAKLEVNSGHELTANQPVPLSSTEGEASMQPEEIVSHGLGPLSIDNPPFDSDEVLG